MHLVDTHCHLFMDPLAGGVSAVLARAVARGVRQVIVPAYDPQSWRAMEELAGQPNVFLAIGLHPWVADQSSGLRLELEATFPVPSAGFIARPGQALTPGPVAIGEIGLDTKVNPPAQAPGLACQLAVLRTQLEFAVDFDRPVILHCRGAFEDLLTDVSRFGGKLKGVLHASSRGPDPARRFIDAGLHIGLGGAITRDRAKRVRQAAFDLPLDKILLETDAPSIGLDGVLPADTEPGHVRDVAEALAVLRGENLETIAEVTTRHARELFRLPE